MVEFLDGYYDVVLGALLNRLMLAGIMCSRWKLPRIPVVFKSNLGWLTVKFGTGIFNFAKPEGNGPFSPRKKTVWRTSKNIST